MCWKQFLMLIPIIGGLLCMVISFFDEQYIVGCLSFLSVIVPSIVWYSDYRENKTNYKQFVSLKETVESYGFSYEENPEMIYAIKDADNHFLFGIRKDGYIEWGAGIPKPILEKLENIECEIKQIKGHS